jgi:hypothetical protein
LEMNILRISARLSEIRSSLVIQFNCRIFVLTSRVVSIVCASIKISLDSYRYFDYSKIYLIFEYFRKFKLMSTTLNSELQNVLMSTCPKDITCVVWVKLSFILSAF